VNDNTTPDTPKIVDMTDPLPSVTLHTSTGESIPVDMQEFVAAAKRLGLGDIQKGDVASIVGYRNAKGQWSPDYQSIRIEREAKD
jgi:hypothetical protein